MSWKKGKAGKTATGTRKQTRTYSAYDKAYQARPEQVTKRVQRNKDRQKAIDAGRVKKGDGKDVHHPSGAANGGRTEVVSAGKNRALKPKTQRRT
jgi:hypothetical protein